MLMTKERRPAIRTLRGWAISVLLQAGASERCEEHGWMRDRADPHARERALAATRQDSLVGLSPDRAVAEVRDVLESIGDNCPECPPDGPGSFRPMTFAKVVAGLSRRRFRQLRPLATPDHRHAPIGRGPTVGLYRLPGTRLRFELLRPTFLNRSTMWRGKSDPAMLMTLVRPIACDEAGARGFMLS